MAENETDNSNAGPTPESASAVDLTAIVVQGAEHDPQAIWRAVHASGGGGETWVRVQPLPSIGATLVEVIDDTAQPHVTPHLVAGLSAGTDGRAAFIHCNHEAQQALVHAFDKGQELEGWMGKPAEIDAHVEAALGRKLADIAAADDGSRRHPFFCGTRTIALCRGRAFRTAVGMPLGLGSFHFHDRGYAKHGDERVALVAYDAAALERAWTQVHGHELAARIKALPEGALGPLDGLRDEVMAELGALGDVPPGGKELKSVHALELLLLTESYFFAGGDAVAYLDERVLPVFSLVDNEPPMDDADEAEALEERVSVLEAMVEVIPFKSPEGSMLEQLEDEELRPLAPWSVPGEEYVGSVFELNPARLRKLLGALDQRELAARIDRFYRAWWRAQTDEPIGGAQYTEWRRGLEQKGNDDLNRFLTHWMEWRLVTEMAAANGLSTALVFYA